jgi:GrpB-like predicted nucleotidyltransferase (UPF0157 family)
VAVVRAWLEGEPRALRARVTHTLDLRHPDPVSVAVAGSAQVRAVVSDWLEQLEDGEASRGASSAASAGARPAVRVRKYDPRWPERFTAEAARIARALGGAAVGIEHVGGTAVPGLAGKPVIDVLLGLRTPDLSVAQVEALRALGYRRLRVRQTGRMYLSKGSPRTHTLHVVEWGGEAWNAGLRFRDLLRANLDEARHYSALKRTLAIQAGKNRALYFDGKSRFIEQALARAAP